MSETQVNKNDMLAQLVKQSDDIRNELVELEKNFNIKREYLLKVQGAIEALNILGAETPSQEVEPTEDLAKEEE